DQQQIAVLAKLGIDAELLLEVLERADDRLRELDADAVRILMPDPAARQRRRPRADGVPLQHDDAAGTTPREMVRGTGAHDAGADDQNVRRLSPPGLLGKGIGADNQSSLIGGKATEISPVAAQWASTLVEESEPIVQRERRAAGRRARRLPADDVSGARP